MSKCFTKVFWQLYQANEGAQAVEKRYQASPNFLLREIGGECVLVPVGEAGMFDNAILSLNETCGYLWKLFQMPCTVTEAVKKAKQDFDGDEAAMEKDIQDFVNAYLEVQLLEEI